MRSPLLAVFQVMGLRRPWRGLNRAGDRPDEAYHLACDGDIDDIGGLAARPQPTISGTEPDLRFPADVANDFWERLDPVNLVTADARAPDMGVAGLGDGATPDGLAARSLTRDQAEIGHELARV